MEFVFDIKHERHILKIIYHIPSETRKIHASIAYSSSSILIDEIIKKKIEMEWFGLFNKDNPTSLDLLEKVLKNRQYIKFYPIRNHFHPKVIYFENYGIYIGSANMSDNAFFNNIEAGVFIPQNELYSDYLSKIIDYFKYLKSISTLFTDDDLKSYRKYLATRKLLVDSYHNNQLENQLRQSFSDLFSHIPEPLPGAKNFGKNENRESKNSLIFIQEWRSTYNELQHIMNFFKDGNNLPSWIPPSENYGVLADQFLHAYYYSYVLKGKDTNEEKSLELVLRLYEENKYRKDSIIQNALTWWKNLPNASSEEDIYILEWAPSNISLLMKDKLLSLTAEEFTTLLLHNHAARNHARQIRKEILGLPRNEQTTIEVCTKSFAQWLYHQKSHDNFSSLEVIFYVLYSNTEAIEARVYNALYNPKYKVDHLGKSIIGELIGWALPENYPIRNNRVNKALRALGYEVNVY